MSGTKFDTPLSERLNIGCQCRRVGVCRYCQDASEARSLEEQIVVLTRRVAELEQTARAQEQAETANANCPECGGEGDWAQCGPCSERFGNAIDLRNAALAQAVREREWQPIETAPWSGPPILLWKANTQEHYVAKHVHGANGPGWCTPDGYEIFRATHWMPLPAPPLAHTGDGK